MTNLADWWSPDICLRLTFAVLSEMSQKQLDGLWIMKVGALACVFPKINCNNFGDPLTFHLALFATQVKINIFQYFCNILSSYMILYN